MNEHANTKPKFSIVTYKCFTWSPYIKRYQVVIVNNHNGAIIARSDKYADRKYVNELAYLLKNELNYASLHFK